ncbi:class I adenylate-forming enzyme family protein [Streptomyces sp. ME19-01-6]|uniref:class I adenylate-forming enzyme family protein n=1 Tax=Streptomyces sp. ME19-01-6 TaxID=3028686 RepID=UPI0029BEE505|nr:AMP-binding protein [Streptomyces sp. ME19-01-6]MDX3229774.1 AMP-binding protein [Streptomyces sp. ME19-01-6]
MDLTAAPNPPRAPSGTLHALLETAAAARPDAWAVRDRTGAWTYRRLAEDARAFAAWLDERGVRRGERVLVRVGNRREFAAMLFGTVRHGAVFVPVNPAMRPFHLTTVAGDCDPALVVARADDPATLPTLRKVTDRPVHELDAVWRRVEAPALRRPPDTTVDCAAAPVSPDDLALLIYTSGSTAAPKAVMCPHSSVLFAARAIASRLRYRADDVVLTALPLSFDYGLYQIFLSVLAGAEAVLTEPDHHVGLHAALREHGVTVVPVVPSLAEMLLRLAGRERSADAPPVRLFTNTGAALTSPLVAGLRRAFPGAAVAPMFGITECKRITVLEPDGDLARPGSVGTALPGTDVVILDDAGQPLPAGRTGQIAVRGPHVMRGYWRAPELTAARFVTDRPTGEVTLHTGDFGHLDEDGHLYFHGRRDDLFKRRGVLTGALEIEAAALDIDGVTAAAVLPPGPDADLTLFAVTELAPERVLGSLGERLEGSKVPAVCRVVAALPLTPNGKTDKQRLRQMLHTPQQ